MKKIKTIELIRKDELVELIKGMHIPYDNTQNALGYNSALHQLLEYQLPKLQTAKVEIPLMKG